MTHCPCEFGPHWEVGAFSRRWHEMHRDHHLAVFPDVDQGTRDNLAMFIERATDSGLTCSRIRGWIHT